jgi:hypothetical protein
VNNCILVPTTALTVTAVGDTHLVAPAWIAIPAGAPQTTWESETHWVLLQSELPILAVADGADSPKPTPAIVKLVPPVVAAFTSRMDEITGASNVKSLRSVPTTAAMLIFA